MDLSLLFSDFSRSFLFTVATVLPIINPPAIAPIFLALTKGVSNADRQKLASKLGTNIFFMLLAAMLSGNLVLEFFGISLPIIRIGGGLLVIATAWNLVNATSSDTEQAKDMAEGYSWARVQSQAFYPLTFPMLCGPGSIAATITVGATLSDSSTIGSITKLTAAILALAVVALIVLFCLRYAAPILTRLGTNGTAVLMRLSAFILLCLGVQIVWDGFSEVTINLLVEAAKHTTQLLFL
ncbi:MAG TPA: NAAT family transporter [Paenalcaligenes hominis]|uniref:UPF0056 membrane protein n=1 Tax=Paenalcaligenes hominis TaxID=643674 RepID=A0A1U9JY15_9BURK|nr:MarC family protein [Paenalcaligenes hominis]AQS50641.1 antibiotic resistance protein [Paenalcaligenes hominis]NJB64458.1 multiple antibiotic resistance protein [Paenalcaligenes hominis]GGE67486.1 UPF0056 membrane protein [Paenalcaligenes hominis]HJH25091.1 NAAT family transporter [Paenalcaligenes hominis]